MDEHRDATRTAYDSLAVAYASALPDLSYEAPLDRAMIAEVTRDLPEGASLLDAGCGTGRLLAHLREQRPTLRLVGVDLSDGMLAEASRATSDVELVRADLAALPFEDARFDAVVAWYSVIHTPTDGLDEIFRELARVSIPGAVILVAFQVGSGERTVRRAYGREVSLTAHLHGPSDVESVLDSVGFQRETSLIRAPWATETHRQAILLSRKRTS
ncbi:methyltransferase domain-containing protein [Microbacterium sp. NPDC077184]|uniref:class I SAM-dependent DNA methyltransferase n=1 Tax=Microbacterium sp. NPDC077184 TaxID=3154764 RepID=UPI00341231C3